jgi:cytochrome c biogenesis protein CcdA
MKRIVLFSVLLLLCLALASAQTTVHYFYGTGCPHCANVEASGILEKVESQNITIDRHEIYFDEQGRQAYTEFIDKLNIPAKDKGIPLAVIDCNQTLSYLSGDIPIINKLEQSIETCGSASGNNTLPPEPNDKITLTSIILGAAVDSINPCAFAVLIFLAVTMLSIGSRRRMLRAAILYIFAVYVTYLLAGIGIFQAIQSLTKVTHYVYLGSGIIVLVAGLIEIKSFFWPGGFSLRIPESAKPTIERIAHKGTLPAVILLGIVVSLFELPCTGGIYLAILTMMSQHQNFSILYLLLYNLIFVLPLLVITIIIYHGTSPTLIEKWRLKERNWMNLAAGLVMLCLGIYILLF